MYEKCLCWLTASIAIVPIDIQGDSWGKVSVLRGDVKSHCEKEYYEHAPNSELLPR